MGGWGLVAGGGILARGPGLHPAEEGRVGREEIVHGRRVLAAELGVVASTEPAAPPLVAVFSAPPGRVTLAAPTVSAA